MEHKLLLIKQMNPQSVGGEMPSVMALATLLHQRLLLILKLRYRTLQVGPWGNGPFFLSFFLERGGCCRHEKPDSPLRSKMAAYSSSLMKKKQEVDKKQRFKISFEKHF